MAFTWLKRPAEGLRLGKVDFAERKADFSNGIVTAQAIVVEDLKEEGSILELVKRITYAPQQQQQRRQRYRIRISVSTRFRRYFKIVSGNNDS